MNGKWEEEYIELEVNKGSVCIERVNKGSWSRKNKEERKREHKKSIAIGKPKSEIKSMQPE